MEVLKDENDRYFSPDCFVFHDDNILLSQLTRMSQVDGVENARTISDSILLYLLTVLMSQMLIVGTLSLKSSAVSVTL